MQDIWYTLVKSIVFFSSYVICYGVVIVHCVNKIIYKKKNVELSMIKIGEFLRKVWSLRNCFLILPPGALAPQGIKGAVKRDVSKHWCTLQWCASREVELLHMRIERHAIFVLYCSAYAYTVLRTVVTSINSPQQWHCVMNWLEPLC